jgi:chromosome segregation ATPase
MSPKSSSTQSLTPAMTNDDLAREMRLMFGKIETELGNVKAELGDVNAELGNVKAELNTVKTELLKMDAKIETEFAKMDKKVSTEFTLVKGEINVVNSKFDERSKEVNNLQQRLDGRELTVGRLLSSLIMLIMGAAY